MCISIWLGSGFLMKQAVHRLGQRVGKGEKRREEGRDGEREREWAEGDREREREGKCVSPMINSFILK